jgi:hypothetical protein
VQLHILEQGKPIDEASRSRAKIRLGNIVIFLLIPVVGGDLNDSHG